METNKVVARFKDGSLMKGKTSDFFPNKTSFHLETLSGETQQIEVEQLKAFCLVKDFDGVGGFGGTALRLVADRLPRRLVVARAADG